MITAVSLALATLPFLMLAHWIFGRLTGGLRQRGVSLLAAGVCVGNGITALLLGAGPSACAYLLLASVGVAYSYFHLFNMALTARRIQLLVQRLDGPARERYDAAKIVDLRVERLERMGILRRDGDQITARAGFFLVAAWLLEKAYFLFY